MTKAELIRSIMELNHSARHEFLDGFTENELQDYLHRLQWLRQRRGPNLLQPESWQDLLRLLEPRCALGIN